MPDVRSICQPLGTVNPHTPWHGTVILAYLVCRLAGCWLIKGGLHRVVFIMVLVLMLPAEGSAWVCSVCAASGAQAGGTAALMEVLTAVVEIVREQVERCGFS